MKTIAGVDVGGTFTDVAVWDSEFDRMKIYKVLSTPRDPREGVLDALGEVRGALEAVVHGTTVITNALIERRGVKVAMLTTAGYRDVIEIGPELRYDTFDLFLAKSTPLAGRDLRFEVTERTSSTGAIVQEVDAETVRRAAKSLVDSGVEAVAVCFLNSYANGQNEATAGDILSGLMDGVAVCCSHAVAPEIREYGRFSTAVANAYVQPLATRYLERLEQELGAPLLVMLSDGGVTSSVSAARRPVAMVESGPAAGVMMTCYLDREHGAGQALSFDMGGTTAKMGLVHDGEPTRSHEIEVARVHRFKKGSGLPVRVPVVDLIEIGAGGGSVGWVDALGLLKVGPHSAGADPGPACYRQGGTEPTVTDADVLLGYLAPESFLGGRMRLDKAASFGVFEELAQTLSLDTIQAAAGVLEVVSTNMANAARMHIAENGRDPAAYRMVAFGGAGPIHAYELARRLGTKEVLFPQGAGVASAVGMLVAPRTVERTQSMVARTRDLDWAAVHGAVARLESEGRELLVETGASHEELRYEVTAEMRYAGQGSEVEVPLSKALLSEDEAAEQMESQFAAVYRNRYGRSLDGFPTEVLSWRVRAMAPPVVSHARLSPNEAEVQEQEDRWRDVYFLENNGFLAARVLRRNSLTMNSVIQGPAVVEEDESTIVIGPGAYATVDSNRNLVMTLTS